MNILLLGEFSSLHKYLKEGLIELGHNVILASSGDGFKKIGGADIIYPETNGSLIHDIRSLYIDPIVLSHKLKNFDVIQVIHPRIFSKIINRQLLGFLFDNNGISSLVAAGEDYANYKAYKLGTFEYSAYDFDNSITNQYEGNSIRTRSLIKQNEFVVNKCDVIIPSLYEYWTGYKDNLKCTNVVPFPINTSKIEYHDNNVIGDKVVFFHGLNRPAAKGTEFIREALMRLKKNYPNDVEIIIDGHMPFDKYMKVISKANVIVDQCCGYGYGINACISMAQGKVVMSGARHETLTSFGIDSSPIVHICPSVDFIYRQMKSIIENKNKICEIGYQSRQYVETLHNYKNVARQYLEIWDRYKS